MKVEMIKDRSWVKRAMRSTMGKSGHPEAELTDKTFYILCLGMHSPIEEMEFWIDAIVPERVHTHLVRHKEIGKYVATSRPDLSHKSEVGAGERRLSFRINAKRLIEIAERRLCKASWTDTTKFMLEVCKQIRVLDPTLAIFLNPPCVKRGYCTEVNKNCGFDRKQVLYNQFKSGAENVFERY